MSHDAGTGYMPEKDAKKEEEGICWYRCIENRMAKTQRGNFAEQLGCGARVFDMRIKCPWFGKKFFFFHGPAKVQVTLDNVVKEFETFIKENPKELIFFYVGHKKGPKCLDRFQQAFSTSLSKTPPYFQCTDDSFQEVKLAKSGKESTEWMSDFQGLIRMEQQDVIEKYGNIVMYGKECHGKKNKAPLVDREFEKGFTAFNESLEEGLKFLKQGKNDNITRFNRIIAHWNYEAWGGFKTAGRLFRESWQDMFGSGNTYGYWVLRDSNKTRINPHVLGWVHDNVDDLANVGGFISMNNVCHFGNDISNSIDYIDYIVNK